MTRIATNTHLACTSSTWAASSSGSASVLSTTMASPFEPAPVTVILLSESRASSLSLLRRAMTRTAASCWYRAVASSSLVRASCSLRLYVSSARESHSFWNVASSAGIEVSVGGRGRTMRELFMGRRSSAVRASPVLGSVPCSLIYCSMSLFSYTTPAAMLAGLGCVQRQGYRANEPDFFDATGSWGASPETGSRLSAFEKK